MHGARKVDKSHASSRRTFVAATAAAILGAKQAAAGNATSPKKHEGPLRVVQIGMQGHFGDVMEGIDKLKDCQLIAVARSTPDEPIENLKRFPAWTSQTRVFDDYGKMLDETRPNIVAVFTPYAHNGEANIEAASRGCHVFSEKPLAATLSQLERLRAERDKAGVCVTAMLPMRTAPPFVAARKAVKEGLIGEPVLISAQKSYRWGTNRPWYYKKREDYGGTIPWVAIHAIDFMRCVSGLDFTSVTARQATKVHKDYPGCEDCGALLFDLSNGGMATLTFDFLRPAKAASHGDDRLRIAGSKGILEVRETEKSFCELTTNDAAPRQLPLDAPKVNVFIDFVESLRTGKPHILAPEDPFRATEVSLKALTAADTRTTMAL
jgi:predicted dehydrogenase